MIKHIPGILIFLLLLNHMAQSQKIEKPSIATKTSFAIIVDETTYSKTEKALKAYKGAVEKDGLGTYLISGNWTNPADIRAILKDLYKQAGPKLEGAVFVGDIPVPMIRDGQHLTSAFKMSQKMNWQRSSVPSDRFYDDFSLEFTFLKQDSLNPLLFYYSIDPSTMQDIHMSIYTGRIKPPAIPGKDKYKLIEGYLYKVVNEKEQVNKLNNMMVFTGHGYNSESLNSWSGENISLREQFPDLFKPGNSIKFMNFMMNTNIKFLLINELRRNDLDMAVLHHHGTPENQLLNGLPYVSNPQPSIENIRNYLRSKVRAAAENPKRDVNEVKEGFVRSLGVPMQWMDDALVDSVVIADSIANANLDINIPDLVGQEFNARFIMLDACLTGSFHLKDYIAGYYPFSGGKNIVTIANSIGVLQDLWPDEMLGLMQYGVRVGNWFKQIAYLETHILGDPTFHFSGKTDTDLNQGIVLESGNERYWEKLLNHHSPDVQALALKQLVYAQGKKMSKTLKDYYYNSANGATRMEALKLLVRLNNIDDIKEMVKAAIYDPYEYIRRWSAYVIKNIGSDDLIPVMVRLAISDRHSERVYVKAKDGLNFMKNDKVIAEIKRQLSETSYITGNEKLYEDLLKSQEYSAFKVDRDRKVMMDASKPAKERLFEVTTLRTYNYHYVLDDLAKIIINNKEDKELRVAALEAMGWYGLSFQRPLILSTCETMLNNKSVDKDIRIQALRTKNRILDEIK